VSLTFTICSHFYKCGSLSPLKAIFMSAAHFHHMQPFLWVRHTLTICSHFYMCASLSPFAAIFISAGYFHYLQPFLWVHLTFTICSHFHECALLSPVAPIFMNAPYFRDGLLEKWWGGRGIFRLQEFFFFCSLLVHEFFFRVKPSARIFFFKQIALFFLSEILIHYLFLCFINYSTLTTDQRMRATF